MRTSPKADASPASMTVNRQAHRDLVWYRGRHALTGISGRAVAAWLRAVVRGSSRVPMPDLGVSGPEVQGTPHARFPPGLLRVVRRGREVFVDQHLCLRPPAAPPRRGASFDRHPAQCAAPFLATAIWSS